MAISPNEAGIREFQDSAAELYSRFSQGMEALLLSKELGNEDRENFQKTSTVVNQVAQRYFETAQQSNELEARRRVNDLGHLQSYVELLSTAKEKEFHLVQEEFQQLREASEFLKLNFTESSTLVLPFDRRIIDLKTRHPHFVGREEIFLQLKEQCITHPSDQPIVLYGPGGVGKTEMAISFANKHLTHFAVVWTIAASTSQQNEASYIELAEALHLPILKEDTLYTIRKRVHRKLEQLEKPWLLIFDNLEELTDFPQRGGNILITARSKEPFSLCQHIEIPIFSEDEAVALLENITGERKSSAMDDLILRLNRYPLLLDQVASHVHLTPSVTIQSFLQTTTGIGDEQIQPHQRYPNTLKAILDQTLSPLPPLPLEWLQICSYLSPDSIPMSFIKTWLESFHQQNPPESSRNAQQILAILVNRGLLRFDPQTQTFSVHQLFQELLQNKEAYLKTAQLIRKIGEPLDFDAPNWEEMMNEAKKWIPHALLLQALPLFETLEAEDQIFFLKLLVSWHRVKGKYEEALTHHQEDLIHYQEDLMHHQEVLMHRYEALKNLGEKRLGFTIFGICVDNIKRYHSDQGKYEEALIHHEQVLTIWQETLDENHPYVATSLNNMGSCLDDQGKYEEALKDHQQALKIMKETLGENHPDVAESLNNIGLCLYDQGKYEDALMHYQQALAVRKEILDENHPDVETTLSIIEEICLKAQKNREESKNSLREEDPPAKMVKGNYTPKKSTCCVLI